MLSIKTHGAIWVDWHMGEPFPLHLNDKANSHLSIEDISYIQADGDELNFILNQYYVGYPERFHYSIPVPAAMNGDPKPKKFIRWYGDTARMIVGNL